MGTVVLAGPPATAQTAEPTLNLTPDAGRAGGLVQASGCGFVADVEIIWTRTGTVIGTASPDQEGCFRTSVTIPEQAQTGAREVRAEDLQGLSDVAFFRVVRPQLSLLPGSGVAGSQVEVSGCGWLAEETITLTWVPTEETLATVSGAPSCFEQQVTIPGGAANGNGDLVATQTFTDGSTTFELVERATFSVEQPLLAFTPALLTFRPVPFTFTDLGVHDVELTQAIQCFDPSNGLSGCPDNSLTQVHGKLTGARIYLSYTDPLELATSRANVPVRFHIRIAGETDFQSVTVRGVAKPGIDQADEDVAFARFTTRGGAPFGVEYFVEVDPDDTIAEFDEGNNRFPASGVRTATFNPSHELSVDGQRTDYNPTGFTGDRTADGWAVTGGAADWLEAILPVNNVDYRVLSGFMDWTTAVSGGTRSQNSNGQHALIRALNRQWFRDQAWSIVWLGLSVNDPDPDHLYGWVTSDGYGGGHADMPVYPHAGGWGVIGIGTDSVGSSPSVDGPDNGGFIFGHELVHDYDVFHTNTGADDCGSNDSSSTFPYATSSIQEFGFNPATGTVHDPSNTHDLMSYCPGGSVGGWIAPFTWQTMFSSVDTRQDEGIRLFDRGPRADRRLFQAAETDESVLVDLSILAPGDTGELDHVEILPAGIESLEASSGRYAVEVRDAGGATLRRHEFDLTFEGEYSNEEDLPEDHPGAGFGDTDEATTSLVLPLDAEGASVALLDGTTELDEVVFSDNAPTVSFSDPSSEEIWDTGATETVAWSPNDADGDAMTSSLFFRNSPAAEFQPLVLDTPEASVEVEVDDLAGGDQSQFRVVVADGTGRTATATSPFVSIPDKDPMATTTEPAAGRRVPRGELLVLRGVGLDLEDGELPAAAHVWSSDRDGELGSGKQLVVEDLSPGTHVMTLTVTDISGNVGTDQRMVHVSTVDAPSTDPGPSEETEPVVASAAFSDPSDGGPYTCTVDYGDGDGPEPGTIEGTTCEGPVHIYEFDGTYGVTVTVRDGDGTVGTASGEHQVTDVAGRDVLRRSGLDRYETAVAASGATYEPGVPVAYVATGLNFADALAGGPAAALSGGPVLLTRDTLPDATRDELTRLAPGRIVVLGGPAAVPDSVVDELEELTEGEVTRLMGLDRYETAAAVSDATYEPGVPVAYVATGLNFADALAGGPAAALSGGPVLLTRDTLPDATRDELTRLAPGRIVVLGGPAAVPDSVVDELEELTAGEVSRMMGSDRYATAVAVSNATWPAGVRTVFVATGLDFADALSGGPPAALSSAPILLVPDEVTDEVAAELTRLAPQRIVVLGGPAAVSDAVVEDLRAFVG